MFGHPSADLLFNDVMADLAYLLRGHVLLEDVTVTTELSQYEQGDRVLSLERSGGRRDRLFDNAYIVFEARGEDYDDCYDITQAARSICWSAPKVISRLVHVEDVAGPMRLVDPVNQDLFYRFSMMFRSQGFRLGE